MTSSLLLAQWIWNRVLTNEPHRWIRLLVRRGLRGPPWLCCDSAQVGPPSCGLALPLCPGIQAAGPRSLPHRFILVPWTCLPQVVVLNGCASLFSALATVLCEAGGE